MSPELRRLARQQALAELGSTLDPVLGGLAAGKGRFQNHFLRDWAISVTQSLAVPSNYSLDPNLIISPGIKALQTAFAHRSEFDILNQKMPGELAHEVHTTHSPQARLMELEKDGWPVKVSQDGKRSMTVYYAKDANSLGIFAVERLLKAIQESDSAEKADWYLQQWWPSLERTILYDIFENDPNGDRLVESITKPGDKIQNQTWRDAFDAFIYGEGEGILPQAPLTHFANNCFAIAALESGGRLSEQMGNYGFAASLARRREIARQKLHEKFWMEQEQCFSPVLDGQGRAIPIVTNESAIGLFTNALFPEYAKKAAERLMEDDLLTDWGTRTRSSRDRHFRANGISSYHRGTIWPQIDTMFGLGCDQYGFSEVGSRIKTRTALIVSNPDFGCIELFSVSPGGDLDYYKEDGKRVACFSQSWVIHGVIGITAPSDDLRLSIAA